MKRGQKRYSKRDKNDKKKKHKDVGKLNESGYDSEDLIAAFKFWPLITEERETCIFVNWFK